MRREIAHGSLLREANIPPTSSLLDPIAPVLENRPLGADHFLLTLASPSIAAAARPGQFVMVRLPDRLDPLLARPMSLHEALPPEGSLPGRIQILHKVVGKGTSLLASMAPGQSLHLLGPLGRPFEIPSPGGSDRALMVAGGVGIALFPFLVPALLAGGWKPVLLFGARSARDLVTRDAFSRRGVEVLTATEDGSHGTRGRVTALLEERLAGAGMIYACGPDPMLRAVSRLANAAAVPCQLSLESAMGCGFGVCLGCVVRVRRGEGQAYARICVEGPTFMATEVIWE
jgi:dihydroorotate dehydrogenase electron transfer subunit